MKQAIAILFDPHGKKYYEAYGPLVPNKKKALRFVSVVIANGAALNRMGRGTQGFWECERQHFAQAYKDFQGWTHTTQEV